MFLICLESLQQIASRFLQFIEENTVFVGIITSIIVSSLWFRKYIKQKRAEAFFGFYAKLSLCLKSLQTRLIDKGQLNISNPDDGNIYSLIYVKDFIKSACPSYMTPTENDLELYKAYAKELKNILLETDNNVYPLGSKRRKWYESQHVLFSFCEFLENESNQHTTNEKFPKKKRSILTEDKYKNKCVIKCISKYKAKYKSKHMTKCKSLVRAINYILKSINNAKY